MSSQYGELWPTNGWDRLASLGHPSKFQWVSCLGFVTAPTPLNRGQPNFARCLTICWAGTLCIHFQGLLPRNGILPGAKFTLRPSLAFSYIGSITAWHSSSGREPNLCSIQQRAPPIFSRTAITFLALAHILVHCVLEKNVPPLTCYNLDIPDPIMIVFSKSVPRK